MRAALQSWDIFTRNKTDKFGDIEGARLIVAVAASKSEQRHKQRVSFLLLRVMFLLQE